VWLGSSTGRNGGRAGRAHRMGSKKENEVKKGSVRVQQPAAALSYDGRRGGWLPPAGGVAVPQALTGRGWDSRRAVSKSRGLSQSIHS
jgi:hypothetical protein